MFKLKLSSQRSVRILLGKMLNVYVRQMYQEEKGSIKKVLSKPMIFENQNTIEVIDDARKWRYWKKATIPRKMMMKKVFVAEYEKRRDVFIVMTM